MMRGMAMLLTLLVLASALFAGWSSTRRMDYFPERLKAAFSDCEFMGHSDRQPVQSDFDDEWFSGDLSAFHEPSLYRRPTNSLRSVRFTWLRSFHDPVVVRIDTLPDGGLQLTAKQRPGGAGFPLDKGLNVAREKVRRLSVEETSRFNGALDTTGLFQAPDSGCFTGTDGAQWILEASDPSIGYRYRNFQSPQEGIEYDIGLVMLELTGWDIGPIY